jgi:hypothetical protein
VSHLWHGVTCVAPPSMPCGESHLQVLASFAVGLRDSLQMGHSSQTTHADRDISQYVRPFQIPRSGCDNTYSSICLPWLPLSARASSTRLLWHDELAKMGKGVRPAVVVGPGERRAGQPRVRPRRRLLAHPRLPGSSPPRGSRSRGSRSAFSKRRTTRSRSLLNLPRKTPVR